MVDPHRVSAEMLALLLVLLLPLEYIVTFKNWGRGLIPKHHPSINSDAAADAQVCLKPYTTSWFGNPSDFSVWVSKQKKKHMNDLRQWLQKRQIVPRTLWPSEDHNQPAHKSSIPLHQPGHGLYRSESTGEFQEESTSISSQRPKGSTKTYLEI